jgi:hypothetical protein
MQTISMTFRAGSGGSSISKVMTYQLATHFILRLATPAPDFLQTAACPINSNSHAFINSIAVQMGDIHI